MSNALGHDPGLNLRWRGAVDAFKAQAAAAWPHEAVGLVLTDGGFLPCPNVHADPEHFFEVAQEIVTAQLIAENLAAVLHSHPSTLPETGPERAGSDHPSCSDMRHQIASAVPWGIAQVFKGGACDPFWFGDQVERPPLIGRRFRHGVDDCYALVRDFHREAAGIAMPDFPRDMQWWDQGEALYDKFGEAGFERVQREDGQLAIGDCFICKVHSPVLNHAGVYIGNGVVLHHLFGHLSMRQAAHGQRTCLDFLVRHKDLPDDFVVPQGLLP